MHPLAERVVAALLQLRCLELHGRRLASADQLGVRNDASINKYARAIERRTTRGRPVCPSEARVITARIMVPNTPIVKRARSALPNEPASVAPVP